jgi:hypothetical protein
MARKSDSEKDIQSKILLEQLNTFTVGPAKGQSGDTVPDTVFDVDDFSRIRNQLNIQLNNLEALNMLNTIGQITNMQSMSGPIPGTGVIKQVQVTQASTSATLFRPNAGEVWEFLDWSGAVANGGGATINHYVYMYDAVNDKTVSLMFLQSSTTTPKDAQPGSRLFIDHNMYITVSSGIGSIAGATVDWLGAFIRVR